MDGVKKVKRWGANWHMEVMYEMHNGPYVRSSDFNIERREHKSALAREAALREELATTKRNEHNSEIAYKAAIEKQEELRNELARIKTISDNNFSIATDRYFALKATEQRNAELVGLLHRALSVIRGEGWNELEADICAMIHLKPTESGASE